MGTFVSGCVGFQAQAAPGWVVFQTLPVNMTEGRERMTMSLPKTKQVVKSSLPR